MCQPCRKTGNNCCGPVERRWDLFISEKNVSTGSKRNWPVFLPRVWKKLAIHSNVKSCLSILETVLSSFLNYKF